MKMYTSYINDYDNANAIWTKYATKPEFADYLNVLIIKLTALLLVVITHLHISPPPKCTQQLKLQSGGRLDLISLLIQPVQRLPRYQVCDQPKN